MAAVFGEALLAITLDALASGAFRSLPLREDAELMVADFDGNWDNGANQVIHRLPAQWLPNPSAPPAKPLRWLGFLS